MIYSSYLCCANRPDRLVIVTYIKEENCYRITEGPEGLIGAKFDSETKYNVGNNAYWIKLNL